MAEANDNEDLWPWDDHDREALEHRFQSQLISLLREVERRLAAGDTPSKEDLLSVSAKLLDASALLDECSANCLAMAASLHNAAGSDAVPPELADGSSFRLQRAVGKPVVLTRTTIDELRGKILFLEEIDGENAIVRNEGDYWGTPLDRILVTTGAEAADSPPGAPGNTRKRKIALSLSKEAAAILKKLRDEAPEEWPPMLVATPKGAQVVRLVSKAHGIDETVAVASLPPSVKQLVAIPEGSTDDEAPNGRQADMYVPLKRGELSNVIQFLTMTSRVGELRLYSAGELAMGHVYVANNRVVHAEFEGEEGVKAVAGLLAQGDVEAVFHDGKAAPKQSVTLTTDQLLIEAAVMSDERAGKRHEAEKS